MFAYFQELESPKKAPSAKKGIQDAITEVSAKTHVGFLVHCGQWSYAAAPRKFVSILGVTGTLSCLSNYEKEIVQNEYKINRLTFSPSLFDKNHQLNAGKSIDITIILEKSRYYEELFRHARQALAKTQPVFVFFFDEKVMKEFTDSPVFKQQGLDVSVVVSSDPRLQSRFEKATRLSGGKPAFTIFPRVYGRGVDFECHDNTVEKQGGVHVIQAFYSDAESEETQIKGRTARMGKSGTYELILCGEDLTSTFNLSESEIKSAINAGSQEQMLLAARSRLVEARVEVLQAGRKHADERHDLTQAWLDSLRNGKPDQAVLMRLQTLCATPSGGSEATHWFFVIDISGSMSGEDVTPTDELWKKNRLGAVLQQVASFMQAKAGPLQTFSLVTFNGSAQEVFTGRAVLDKELMDMLAAISVDGGTNFSVAFSKVLEILQRSEGPHNNTKILFLSDGEGGGAETQVNSLMSWAQDSKIDICVWTCKFSADKGGEEALKAIADLGHGQYNEALDAASFEVALTRFAAEALVL
eukprot:gb/GEZN01004058.1/.p1 GENE.gb/GEZN01004058.1/~~gb/GEZN01004058.1/.p1  ORF type:complete len:587 (-),score=97.59 gb/GEZN01004058.1/:276-1856(-)